MSGRLFIHATNVHQGGGRALLAAVLNALPTIGRRSVLSLDERMEIPSDLSSGVLLKRVKPTVLQRFLAERWLAKNVKPGDFVLCFGNLPPLFKLVAHTAVFVQNRYLIDRVTLEGFPIRVWLRLVMERLWLANKLGNVNEFIVQTPTMKKLLESKVHGAVGIRLLPFVEASCGYQRHVEKKKDSRGSDCDFVYVASGEPHKNHFRLIEAWCLLAEEALFPSLCLTVDKSRFPDICGVIDKLGKQYGLKVNNLGTVAHQDVLALYRVADALIYPSTFESFGLPLIEARQAGLPILAPELDYVRDVVDPEETFDPESPVSIARAVKRFMGAEEQPLPLSDAAKFIAALLEG